ncbi:HlyD family efflux transporter periplasmic adaptor subunit [Thiothrix nivea]|uniref:Secretion protein HlyD n=1 Tax=Thiothrix nivea (strain ATCC 35100 / DSM 5205 / JP2) TaxID=870187 RepID=A0A656HE97_THINJ|nr:HlyD family efflux transporter periplasmic adaptor subunit [Thiothrix nivea]EIJ35238.1 secretion protein HlyD [Thiothrix nivea DSM 5205]
MADKKQGPEKLNIALADHSIEGIEIFTSEPSRLFGLMIWLISGLLLSGLVWSFFGKAPEIVVASGVVGPDTDVRRFYAPIAGELVDIFVTEGQPVLENDVLARLNARDAVEVATQALEAQIQLEKAEREFDDFPNRKRLMNQKVAALERQIEAAKQVYDRNVADGLSKLKQAQRAKLQKLLSDREKARSALDIARKEKTSFERLLSSGGVARNQVELKRSEYAAAQANLQVAEANLSELEFTLSQEDEQATEGLEQSYQDLIQLQINLETLKNDILNEESKLDIALRSAKVQAEAASRVSFNDIDEENFLRVRAPESGVITQLAFTQSGDKIQANTPLGGIAPNDAKPILKIEILESDRGLLKIGQPVKMKFNAFSYQRYGFIEGVLEYISPTAEMSQATNTPAFKGRVSLEKTAFDVKGEQFDIKYGMLATAEIIVEQRRMIDLVLSPMKSSSH